MTPASYNVPLNMLAYTRTHTISVKPRRILKKKKRWHKVQVAFSQRGTSSRASFLSVWLWVVGALLGLRGAPRSQGGDKLDGRTVDGADTGTGWF